MTKKKHFQFNEHVPWYFPLDVSAIRQKLAAASSWINTGWTQSTLHLLKKKTF